MIRAVVVHLVVVADACRDLTAQVARQHGASVVTVGAGNVGAARAAGVREVLHKARDLDPADVWLATTDADSIVSAGWLCQQARYASQDWGAVVGTIQVADWSEYHPATRALFSERYDGQTGSHPHVHGANLGLSVASAYLRVGGFPAKPTAEDHAFVSALTASGYRVLHTRALPVVTSGRREARAPTGFSRYLAELDGATA
jgi:hypothetical protein